MPKREFLMLAAKYVPGKFAIGGYFLSEKLDGMRCYWDGGVSRGLRCSDVPWANVAKHSRFVTERLSTGLWTRYAQPISAPIWWLDCLPKIPLDGELTMGRGSFEETMSCCKQHIPDSRWKNVRYAVFDSPHHSVIFSDGAIRNPPNYSKTFVRVDLWYELRRSESLISPTSFFSTYLQLRKLAESPVFYVLPQFELPGGYSEAHRIAMTKLDEVTSNGGEGIMLRSAISRWKPERTTDLLKVKAFEDAEGTVIGYISGKETDLEKSRTGEITNKLLGLMGSIRVRMDSGIVFDLTGFSDSERRFATRNPQLDPVAYATSNPGAEMPDWITNDSFPRGSRITFRFRELTNDGKPKEARYWRKYGSMD